MLQNSGTPQACLLGWMSADLEPPRDPVVQRPAVAIAHRATVVMEQRDIGRESVSARPRRDDSRVTGCVGASTVCRLAPGLLDFGAVGAYDRPVLDDDVAFAGVDGQADLVRRGEVSARELVELALGRIERLDRELNAFGAVYAERALLEAAQADARARAGEDRPLLGVPVAVKDEIDIAGEVTSYGTGAMVSKAPADAEVVRRLRAAGAIVVGKTKMPEFGLWPFTESVTWGVTRNPWDPERTPGGSSGGSAAAVAAGMVPAALGADGAGSIRIPAACCGLFGLKPSRDRVPRTPHDRDGSHWIVFGALTRSVRDAAVMLDVLGDDGQGFAPAARTRPERLRIAVAAGFPPGTRGRLSDDVRAALDGTATQLRSLGHTVLEGKVDLRASDVPVIVGLILRGVHDLVAPAERPQRLERRTRAFARAGALLSTRTTERLLKAERAIAARLTAAFDDHDLLITPVLSAPAVPAGIMEGRGATVTYLWETGWVPFTILWNITGQPAASVPAGFSAEGLPLAVQIVGRPGDERTVLALAAELEAERPWADRRPPIA
jgi:amidase